jgi:uncharacterized protein YacL
MDKIEYFLGKAKLIHNNVEDFFETIRSQSKKFDQSSFSVTFASFGALLGMLVGYFLAKIFELSYFFMLPVCTFFFLLLFLILLKKDDRKLENILRQHKMVTRVMKNEYDSAPNEAKGKLIEKIIAHSDNYDNIRTFLSRKNNGKKDFFIKDK